MHNSVFAFGMPMGAEWFVILFIVVLIFGAAKLPALAKSSGQALKIFKNETKDLLDSSDGPKQASDETPVAGELAPGPATDPKATSAQEPVRESSVS